MFVFYSDTCVYLTRILSVRQAAEPTVALSIFCGKIVVNFGMNLKARVATQPAVFYMLLDAITECKFYDKFA